MAIGSSVRRGFATVVRGSGDYAVVFSNRLQGRTISELFQKRIAAVVWPGFYPPSACEALSAVLLSGKVQEYTNAPGIGRVGIAYYETPGDPQLKEQYFSSALTTIEDSRRYCAPYPSPMDLARLRLDEAWPYGASLARSKRRAMFTGICRALEPGKEILPHEDKLERDDVSRKGKPLWGQLAMNVYVQASGKSGGILQLWKESLSTEEYDALRGDSYGIERGKLSSLPIVEIKPDRGDLVLFNSTNLHAVTTVADTVRLSIAQFVGCEGPKKGDIVKSCVSATEHIPAFPLRPHFLFRPLLCRL